MPTQTTTSRAVTVEARAEMIRQGLTYGDLATLTGISTRQLGRRFTGENDFSVSELIRVADALKVPLSTLTARAEQHAA